MPPFARFDRLDEEKQVRILDAALREFLAHGFEGASLNSIIADSEISKGSFYYYFEDKLDLFMTVVRREISFEEFMGRHDLFGSDCEQVFWARIDEMTCAGMKMYAERPELLELGRVLMALPDRLKAEGPVAEFFAESGEWLARILVHGQQIGALRTDIPLPIMIKMWMALDTIMDQWTVEIYPDADDEERERHRVLQVDAFRRLFAP